MIRRIARPLLGSIFVYNGFTGLTKDPGAQAEAAAPLVGRANETLPESAVLPTDPRTWVRINAGVQLGGGLLLATGRAPRAASLALAGSLVPTTVVDHSFWNETEPAARRDQQVQFLKNISLLGGLLIAGFDTEGKPGVAWRARRAANRASSRVADGVAAITPNGDDRTGGWHGRAQAAQDWGAHAVERAKPVLTDTVERAKPVLSDTVENAKPVLSDAVDRARPVLSDAAHTASDLLGAAGDKLHGLREEVSDEAGHLVDAVRSGRR